MNPDALLTRLRLEQRYLIDIDKKLHELEYLLPGADPVQFLDAAKRTALLSERSTAQLRSFLFTIYGGMPQDYYLQAAEMQGIRIDVTDGILSVRLPALLPKKTHTEASNFAVITSCGTKAVCRTTKSSPLPRMHRLHRTRL